MTRAEKVLTDVKEFMAENAIKLEERNKKLEKIRNDTNFAEWAKHFYGDY